jgi:hypothetical protein
MTARLRNPSERRQKPERIGNMLKEVVADYHLEVVGLIGRRTGVRYDEIDPWSGCVGNFLN